MADSLCCVCREKKGEYKCPKCKKLYCSVACSKIHKEECKESTEESINSEVSNLEAQSPFEEFRKHPNIIKALGDPRLQKIIREIDSAKNREALLNNVLENNSEFKEFVDQLLESMPLSIQP